MTRRIAHAAIVALVLVLAVVPAASPAKAREVHERLAAISIATPLVYDANGDGLPNYGDVLLFNVSTTATAQPWVN